MTMPLKFTLAIASFLLGLVRKRMPTRMWRVYNRIGISPYKPATYHMYPTSTNFALSPVKRIVKPRRNLIHELENISLHVAKD